MGSAPEPQNLLLFTTADIIPHSEFLPDFCPQGKNLEEK
jgi:hypothetical protein